MVNSTTTTVVKPPTTIKVTSLSATPTLKPGVPEHETEVISRSILLIMCLIIVNATAQNYRRKLCLRFPDISKYLSDTTITTLLGVLTGVVLSMLNHNEVLVAIGKGYQNLFMIVLLPPIIFESTINMNRSSFFKSLGSILMFAIFGTCISILLVSFGLFLVGHVTPAMSFTMEECFAFGSLISSTDPVSVLAVFKEINADKMLWSLIFGESILNDAISIAAYNTVSDFDKTGGIDKNPVSYFLVLFFGSVILGFVIGIICAVILKNYMYIGEQDADTQQENKETILMIVIPWTSYLIGEALGLSGIVTILFCGIFINKYALPNMSILGRKLTESLYRTLSSTFENLAFMFVGVGFFSFPHDWAALGYTTILFSIILITGARFIQIYLISWIINMNSNKKVRSVFKSVMATSGFRGAMAFALAIDASNRFSRNSVGSAMLTLTLTYAFLTIFVLGTVIIPVLEYYDIREKPNNENEQLTIENPPVEEKIEYEGVWDKIKSFLAEMDDRLVYILIRYPNNEVMRANLALKKAVLGAPVPDKQVRLIDANSVNMTSHVASHVGSKNEIEMTTDTNVQNQNTQV